MSPRYYGCWILDATGRPVQEPDPDKAWRWRQEHPERWKLAWDALPGAEVSTVFLPIDHRFGDDGPPVLFETMVFEPGSFRDRYCQRYTSWWEAMAGHAEIVRDLQEGRLAMEDVEQLEQPEPGEEAGSS